MSKQKYFCLNCYQTNSCKCGTTEHQFPFSYKLRPPKDISKKRKWRKFLKDCPAFVNMVSPPRFKEFNILLKKINWDKPYINGFMTPLELDPDQKEVAYRSKKLYCPFETKKKRRRC
jgi:hypothetical protein